MFVCYFNRKISFLLIDFCHTCAQGGGDFPSKYKFLFHILHT